MTSNDVSLDDFSLDFELPTQIEYENESDNPFSLLNFGSESSPNKQGKHEEQMIEEVMLDNFDYLAQNQEYNQGQDYQQDDLSQYYLDQHQPQNENQNDCEFFSTQPQLYQSEQMIQQPIQQPQRQQPLQQKQQTQQHNLKPKQSQTKKSNQQIQTQQENIGGNLQPQINYSQFQNFNQYQSTPQTQFQNSYSQQYQYSTQTTQTTKSQPKSKPKSKTQTTQTQQNSKTQKVSSQPTGSQNFQSSSQFFQTNPQFQFQSQNIQYSQSNSLPKSIGTTGTRKKLPPKSNSNKPLNNFIDETPNPKTNGNIICNNPNCLTCLTYVFIFFFFVNFNFFLLILVFQNKIFIYLFD